MIYYNQSQYSELFKRSQNHKKQDKSLSKENRKDYLKLLEYSAILSSHLNREIRYKYLELLKKFIVRKN